MQSTSDSRCLISGHSLEHCFRFVFFWLIYFVSTAECRALSDALQAQRVTAVKYSGILLDRRGPLMEANWTGSRRLNFGLTRQALQHSKFKF